METTGMEGWDEVQVHKQFLKINLSSLINGIKIIFLYQVLGEGAFGDVKLLFNKELHDCFSNYNIFFKFLRFPLVLIMIDVIIVITYFV
jgi:hypothetical protein